MIRAHLELIFRGLSCRKDLGLGRHATVTNLELLTEEKCLQLRVAANFIVLSSEAKIVRCSPARMRMSEVNDFEE